MKKSAFTSLCHPEFISGSISYDDNEITTSHFSNAPRNDMIVYPL